MIVEEQVSACTSSPSASLLFCRAHVLNVLLLQYLHPSISPLTSASPLTSHRPYLHFLLFFLIVFFFVHAHPPFVLKQAVVSVSAFHEHDGGSSFDEYQKLKALTNGVGVVIGGTVVLAVTSGGGS